MNNTYRQIVLISIVVITVGVLYPMGLWVFLHDGLGLEWGLARAYGLWVGFLLVVSLVGLVVYLLGDDKPKRRIQ